MHAAYLVVTFVTVAANVFSAVCDFVRYKQVAIAMERAGVPQSWMTTLAGLRVPLIGTAATVGLILFFVGAIITHLRAYDYSFGLATVFLLLAVASLGLAFHARGSMALSLVAM